MSSVADPFVLLLTEQLMPAETQKLLASAGLADMGAAQHRLLQMARDPQVRLALVELLPELLRALNATASPDRALVNLERLAQSCPEPVVLFRTLAGDPHLLEMLMTLFAGSQFLSEILLRHPEYLSRLADPRALAQPKSLKQLCQEAEAALLPGESDEAQLDALRRLQHWEYLRIGACDLLGLLDLPTVTVQLAHLADSAVRACLHVAARQAQGNPTGFAVIALGKLGGSELNYSSDIDLLFIAAAKADEYQRLGKRLIDALARATAEGFLYRVDMRLRPWGQVGALVSSIEGYLKYLGQHAQLWERQAILKARPIAGDVALGSEFLRRVTPQIYEVTAEAMRVAVRGMKERIEAELSRTGKEWGEVKLGRGSIRDVEFVTQYLQCRYGAQHARVRSPNTLDALRRLYESGLLAVDEYRVLVDGYTFLRPIEHYLQMMQHRQTHSLPTDERELAYLARRLGFGGEAAGANFLVRYLEHAQAIRAVYQQYLESEALSMVAHGEEATPVVRRHIERMAPSYEETFSERDIARHAELAEQLDASNLVEVAAAPLDDVLWRVTIVAYDYPGELSVICGLLFAYGFSIRDGHVFTYEPRAAGKMGASATREDGRRKIVDVFNLRPVRGKVTADLWPRYAADLAAMLRRLEVGQQTEAHGELAKRVAVALRDIPGSAEPLQPIDIVIDNQAEDRYTVLYIDAPDTIGFLYEFSGALTLAGAYIARVTVDSLGNRVHDTLYLTDPRGNKITSPEKQRELRAATVLIKHFTHLLPQSPNPESALLHFRQLLGQLFMRPDWPAELSTLERPEVLGALARLLGVSDFLWEDFLRMQYANLFPVVRDLDALAVPKGKVQLRAELEAALVNAADGETQRTVLNAFKDREMFRVDMRHIQGLVSGFRPFSAELTDLAEVVVEAAYQLCDQELRQEYGTPCLTDGRPCPLSVCALGKCGGRELGYASDIELMFVYAGNGLTTGPEVITTAESYEKLVSSLLGTIRAKREGIFELDLRLRPYSSAGSLAVSLDSFRRYFAPGGPAWAYERQALLKLRPIAGDTVLGEELVALRDAYVYCGEPFDLAAMRAMRERQIRHLVAAGTINVKFSPGALVDAEYLVQGLQIRYGCTHPAVRLTNTRETIKALHTEGLLIREDYERLRDAHSFLRHLIDALRMVRGNAQDLTVPPPASEQFAFLARRLEYGGDVASLRADLARHMLDVQELSARLLG